MEDWNALTDAQLNDEFALHTMHRQRMRERAKLLGFSSLKPHEVMEIILFCAYRRANTNDISHALIERFGSVGGVLEASEEDLMTVEGVGYHAAQVIRAFSGAIRAYRQLANDGERFILNRAQAMEYARYVFADEIRPQTWFVLIDGNSCLSFSTRIPAGAFWLNEKTLNLIILRALKFKAHYAFILSKKNLNYGGVSPVERFMVSELDETLRNVGIVLVDYILVTPFNTISLRQDMEAESVVEDRGDYGVSVRERWISNPGEVWEAEPLSEKEKEEYAREAEEARKNNPRPCL